MVETGSLRAARSPQMATPPLNTIIGEPSCTAVTGICNALGPEAIEENPRAKAKETTVGPQAVLVPLLNSSQMVSRRTKGASIAARWDTLQRSAQLQSISVIRPRARHREKRRLSRHRVCSIELIVRRRRSCIPSPHYDC
jgi:hypothetical protein